MHRMSSTCKSLFVVNKDRKTCDKYLCMYSGLHYSFAQSSYPLYLPLALQITNSTTTKMRGLQKQTSIQTPDPHCRGSRAGQNSSKRGVLVYYKYEYRTGSTLVQVLLVVVGVSFVLYKYKTSKLLSFLGHWFIWIYETTKQYF